MRGSRMSEEEQKKLLLILDKAIKLGFAEVIIQIQDGKAVTAQVTEKIKLR